MRTPHVQYGDKPAQMIRKAAAAALQEKSYVGANGAAKAPDLFNGA